MKSLIVVMIAFLISGCTTSYLWSNPPKTEKLIGFYGIEEEDTLLFIGEKHTYVFKHIPDMKESIMAAQDIRTSAEYSEMHIDSDNKVSGSFILTAYPESKEIKQKLKRLGFTGGYTNSMTRLFNLYGERYLTEGHPPLLRFKQQHIIRYTQDHSMSGVIGRAVFTPFSVVLDTAAIVSVLVLNYYQICIYPQRQSR